MSLTLIQEILPFVEKPSQYMGNEINSIQKDLNEIQLRFCLAFPDLYEIGTSHFGMQILYHLLNAQEHIYAERVFAPGIDMAQKLIKKQGRLFSLETHTPLQNFDIIGFSLLYELNYTNILYMLDLAGIPFYAAKRHPNAPLLIAGGPCTCNPEPIADLFDAIIIGDGEVCILEIAQAFMRLKKDGGFSKNKFLDHLSQIDGIYVPSLYQVDYTLDGFQTLVSNNNGFSAINRRIVDDMDQAFFPKAPIVPYGRPIHDRLRLEIARGCSRGCRFCQAGMLYRPVRERSYEQLTHLLESSLSATGYDDVSLLSLSTGDYGCLSPLITYLLNQNLAVSLPSFRAGSLPPSLMELIKHIRKTGFTIAPEAGTQRLRNVINKNITEQDIFETISHAFALGWMTIKLYFMIGLPTETIEDLDGIIELVSSIRTLKNKYGRNKKIHVSITTFIPKSHTPFQWAPQISMSDAKEKLNYLRKHLKFKDITLKWTFPEHSCLEGLLARGDRRMTPLLIEAYQMGCRFDAWHEHFDFSLWQNAFYITSITPEFYLERVRSLDEPLPWDHINTFITKDFLRKEFENASSAQVTSDCRDGVCHQCGVCNFDTLLPKFFSSELEASRTSLKSQEIINSDFQKIKVSFSKMKFARYFGHLEMVNIFVRAFKRASIPIMYSQGFHPMPKLIFDDTLPVGLASLDENFYLSIPRSIDLKRAVVSINALLPDGLNIHRMAPALTHKSQYMPSTVTYQVTLKGACFDPDAIKQYQAMPQAKQYRMHKKNRKGNQKTFEFHRLIRDIVQIDTQTLQLVLTYSEGNRLRPMEIIPILFNLDTEVVKSADIIKMKTTNNDII